MVGNIGGDGIARVAADADNYKVKLHPGDKRPGQELHRGAIRFEQLGNPASAFRVIKLRSSGYPTGGCLGPVSR